MTQMIRYHHVYMRSHKVREALLNWWRSIMLSEPEIQAYNDSATEQKYAKVAKVGTGQRPALQRAKDVPELLMAEGVRSLMMQVRHGIDRHTQLLYRDPKLSEEELSLFPDKNHDKPLTQPSFSDVEAFAVVAGVLSHVRVMSSSNLSFAREMGKIDEQSGKAPVSHLRFQQLLACQSSDELLTRMRRSVALLGKTAPVASVADDILCWFQQRKADGLLSVKERLEVRLANDYYEDSIIKNIQAKKHA